jgi:hypothetical protein
MVLWWRKRESKTALAKNKQAYETVHLRTEYSILSFKNSLLWTDGANFWRLTLIGWAVTHVTSPASAQRSYICHVRWSRWQLPFGLSFRARARARARTHTHTHTHNLARSLSSYALNRCAHDSNRTFVSGLCEVYVAVGADGEAVGLGTAL